jgi:hypothetical protein
MYIIHMCIDVLSHHTYVLVYTVYIPSYKVCTASCVHHIQSYVRSVHSLLRCGVVVRIGQVRGDAKAS